MLCVSDWHCLEPLGTGGREQRSGSGHEAFKRMPSALVVGKKGVGGGSVMLGCNPQCLWHWPDARLVVATVKAPGDLADLSRACSALAT